MHSEYMLIVDNVTERRQALMSILHQLKAEQPELPEPRVCLSPREAIAFSSGHDCPVVFTAVNLTGMNGFTMIEQIRKQNNHTNFILLADHQEYIIQALMMKLRPSGSIMGIPDMDAVLNELDNLWFPLSS